MTAIKETSVIQENKSNAFSNCPVTFVMERIGGYWKPIILFNLLTGTKRYNELKKSIPTITEKMLIQHLKQLEADGLVIRKAKPVVPPFVTYQLSKKGKELRPVLYAMAEWAVSNSGQQTEQFKKQMEDFPK
ncbi:winged helix-turn-helix transcriptional regulator [Fluviicola chungangensis]|uniref:Helix-turn-helix transcriptional regulator n=1 Tax=Fluviicola chungangensis TaxID=2597671 RepID=A0A556N7E2_9FLAO|nr:helix-turn-helix domain-containing protein [Fluviicola chungangensis]TSJ47993.1 helix-turn-helix transcriptional regulator [Fluviicola chungangensis]